MPEVTLCGFGGRWGHFDDDLCFFLWSSGGWIAWGAVEDVVDPNILAIKTFCLNFFCVGLVELNWVSLYYQCNSGIDYNMNFEGFVTLRMNVRL